MGRDILVVVVVVLYESEQNKWQLFLHPCLMSDLVIKVVAYVS